MPIRFIICCITIVVAGLSCNAQIGFEIKAGYSTYSMSELSKFLHAQAAPVPFKVTNDFPGNLTGGASIYYSFREGIESGIDYTYNKTIGRVHYRDYSGEIGLDQEAVAHAVGAFTRISLFESHHFSLKASAMLSAWVGSVNFYQYLQIGTDRDEIQLSVVSTNIGISGALEPVYGLSEDLYIGARIGGMIEIPRPLHLKEDSDAVLRDDNGNDMHAEWAGFRSELFVGFKIPR